MSFYIGTSGWSYQHWQGVFYPPDMPSRQWLDHYKWHYQTVELNASFYRWPADTTFARWRRVLPDGFLMSVKASAGLTHRKRLYQPERWLARIAAGLQHLGPRLGVLLVQLPPNQPCDLPRLAYFLEQAPAWLRLALEFRHPTWHQEAVFDLLAQHGAAYCVMSGAQLPCILRATAPFVYVRLHGPDYHHLYAGSYSDDDLRWWADRCRDWAAQGLDVFAYFNNDGGGNAVRNAAGLRHFLGA